MFNEPVFDFNENESKTGIYRCTRCSHILFEASRQFSAGCGFPSFWDHAADGVRLNPLHTYGRHRIQLLCSGCGNHLGHLFHHKHTPTKVRYCINGDSIQLTAA